MSFLYHASVFLRNVLVKQHPYFSCCASCGEIKVPLAERLCTSLAFSFPVDAVILPDDMARDGETASARTLESLKTEGLWLRRIFVPRTFSGATPSSPDRVSFVDMDDLLRQPKRLEPDAYLHLLPEISEHYLIVKPGFSLRRGSIPLDFFTPNGIPLLRLKKKKAPDGGFAVSEDVLSQTCANSKDFLEEYIPSRNETGGNYALASGRWAFRTGRAIPAASDEEKAPDADVDTRPAP